MKYMMAVVCGLCMAQSVHAVDVAPLLEQTITLSVPTEVRVGDAKLRSTATIVPSGNIATITVAPASAAVCGINASGFLTFTTPGSCTVVATHTGDATYAPAHIEAVITVLEQLTGEIHGCVFDDVNENGRKDTGEPGIPGLQVQMKMPDLSIRGADHRTDSEGCYVFSGLGSGLYKEFFIEAGQQIGDEIVDPPFIFDQAGSFTSGSVSLATNSSVVAEANFGGKKRGRVAGSVYADTNGDTVRDSGEVLLGWTVTATPVLESKDVPPPLDTTRTVRTTTTTSGGYEFVFEDGDTGLWMLQITPPPGWTGSLSGPAYTLVYVQAGTDASGLDVQLAPYTPPEPTPGDGGEHVPPDKDPRVVVFTTATPPGVAPGGSGGNGPLVQSGFGPTAAGIAAGGSSEQNQTFAYTQSQESGVVAGVSTFKFVHDMGYGSRIPPDVVELQKVLIVDGYLHIATPTGYFGPLTFVAVKQYQAARGIIQTGYVGSTTRAALNVR